MGRGSFCLLRVPVSQNDCSMEVELSVFRVHWVSVMALSCPHVNNQFRTLLRDTKILTMFLLSVIEKFIDWLETKMVDVDPSLVRQHVRPFKNNWLCQALINMSNNLYSVLKLNWNNNNNASTDQCSSNDSIK